VPTSFTAATVLDLIADINAANAAGGSNTISLVTAKVFTLTAVNNTTDGTNGLPVITANDNLTFVGNGDVIERSTAKGTLAFRLFDVAAGASLTLSNLTLQGGLADPINAHGGAVYNQGDLHLDTATIQNNTARSGAVGGHAYGGGIFSDGSGVALTITGCTIRNNLAVGGRGRDASVNILGQTTPGGSGGGADGGGLLAESGSVAISNSTFSGNAAQGGDGGSRLTGSVHAVGGAGGTAFGAGLAVSGCTVTIHNCSLTANVTQGGKGIGTTDGQGIGGGMYLYADATVSLDAFTVSNTTNNKASTSGNNIFGSYTVIP
jgi:hypothetical protein